MTERSKEVAAGPHETQWGGRKARMEEVLEIKDGPLYWKGILCFPEDEKLKQAILKSEHDARIASHFGQDKTTELIWWNF